jgi:uncharacterized protein with gpF-like domain
VSTFSARLAYRRLHRVPPKPGAVAQRPPRGTVYEAQYRKRLVALMRQFRDHVEDIGRSAVHADALRTDGKAEIRAQLKAAHEALVKASGLEAWLKRMGGRIADGQSAYTERVTKLPPTRQGHEAQLKAFADRNIRLIKKLGDQQAEDLSQILWPAQAQGKPWSSVVGAVAERLGVGERHARLIARDQVGKFNGEQARLSQESVGVSRYRWSTSRDNAVRGRPGGEYANSQENHWILEGKEFAWNAPPEIPGTSERAHPGQRIQCRCVAVPIIEEFE